MHLWKTFLDVTLHGKAVEYPVLGNTTNIINYYRNIALTANRIISEIYETCRIDSDVFLSVTVA